MSEHATAGGRAPAEDLEIVLLRLSHEIRNPLASLKAGTQLLQRLTRPEGEIAEFFASLLTQIGRIDRIVDGVHMLSRLDRGEPQPLDIGAAVAGVLREGEARALRAGVALRSDPGPSATVRMDPQSFQGALLELLGNAFQASGAGGWVTVSWDADRGEPVRVHVDDEGPGVAAENTDKVFMPFFSTQPQGRGLGLCVATRICHLAGGTVEWRNRTEGGCRFSLLLPAVAAREPQAGHDLPSGATMLV